MRVNPTERAPPIPGLMQDWPLTTDKIIAHAARWHGTREVVSRLADKSISRKPYAAIRADAARFSNALLAAGIRPGDRVATLAMNGTRHLEAWYGISGIGAICHTLNPRLFIEQLVYIVNHAEDRLLFADAAFTPLVASLLGRCPSLERVVYLTACANGAAPGAAPGAPPAAPPAAAPGARPGAGGLVPQSEVADFMAGHEDVCDWGGFDENTAAGLCYTSGTTGDPKGVLYSHRSNFIHALTTIQPDVFSISVRDVILAVVPMYHANAWGLTFSAPAVGATLILPGGCVDAASLFELMETERVTLAAGVPTIWLALLDYLAATGQRPATLERVIVGGSACPERILRGFAAFDIELIHAWGMTEMSPVGCVSRMTPALDRLSFEEQVPWRLKQGRSPCGVDLKLVDDCGATIPHDGTSSGHLRARGPAVAGGYYRSDAAILDDEGFFDTGDIATIDEQGFMRITDRAKDIIKSGGEWISSIEVENAALSHAAVGLAAVIGVPHPRWGERPCLYVRLREGSRASSGELLDYLATRLARWCVPDEVVFIGDMPLGSTGKIDKIALRAMRDGSRDMRDGPVIDAKGRIGEACGVQRNLGR